MNKTKMSAIFVFTAFLVSTFAIAGMVPAAATTTAPSAVKHVAIVFSTGGLGDKSFNDAGFKGAQEANDTSKVQIDYVEPKTVDEINTYIESFAASTSPVYDLIIAIGFSSAGGVNTSSLAHPDRNFAIIDDNSINRSNVADITFKEQEGSFLVGAMAAMVSRTGTIGFLGGLDIPLINKFRYGYEQGAQYINPNITVLAQYAPDANNPWGDVAGGKQVANTQISNHADVIYAAAGGTGLGVFDAANESRQNGNLVYGIGVDSDQDYLAPGIVLTSMVKRVDTAVFNLINTTIDGTVGSKYLGNAVALGLAQNGVAMSDMTYTSFIKNSNCTATTTRGDVETALRQQIIAGTISVSPDSSFTPNTVAHACTVTAPTAPPVTSSGATSSTSSVAPGFELLPLFAFIIAIPIVRKYKKQN